MPPVAKVKTAWERKPNLAAAPRSPLPALPRRPNAGPAPGAPGKLSAHVAWMMLHLVGERVAVQAAHIETAKTEWVDGILHAVSEEGVVVKTVRRNAPPPGVQGGLSYVPLSASLVSRRRKGATAATLIIPNQNVVQIVALGAKSSSTATGSEEEASSSPSSANGRSSSGFATDSAIAAGTVPRADRELVAWDDGNGGVNSKDGVRGGLELGSSNGKKSTKGWDQFKVNAQQFGVHSTYDENLYTTDLNKVGRSQEERLQMERKATQLAREIERGSRTSTGDRLADLHIREERGETIGDEEGVDEETRFSGVVRPSGGAVTADYAATAAAGGAAPAAKLQPAQADDTKEAAPTASPAASAEVTDEAKLTSKEKMRLALKAKEFKMSASAPAFVPGAGGGGGTPASPYRALPGGADAAAPFYPSVGGYQFYPQPNYMIPWQMLPMGGGFFPQQQQQPPPHDRGPRP